MAQVRWTGKRLGKHRAGDVVTVSESHARFYEKFKFAQRIDEATGETIAPAPAPARAKVQTRELKAEGAVSATKAPESRRRYRRADLEADDK